MRCLRNMSQLTISMLLSDPLTWVIVIGSYAAATVAVAFIRHVRVKNAPKRALPPWASARYPRRPGDALGNGNR